MPAPPERTALYRLYDESGRLLYVGITKHVLTRWKQHAAEKLWWPDVRRFEFVWCESREIALADEDRAIKTESPLHNYNGATDESLRRAGRKPANGRDPVRSLKARIVQQAYTIRVKTWLSLLEDGCPKDEADKIAREAEQAHKDASGLFPRKLAS